MRNFLTCFTVLWAVMLSVSCSKMNITNDNCSSSNSAPDKLYISLTNLNDYTSSTFEECEYVTVLVFDTNSGNRLLYKELKNDNGKSEIFSLPETGPYNYYFCGNVKYAGVSFESALKNAHHIDDVSGLRKIKIDANYYNQDNLWSKRKVLLYANYRHLEAPRNFGFTVESPWKFNANLTLGVAKVEVKFYQNHIGLIPNMINKVRLSNIITDINAPSCFETISSAALDNTMLYDTNSIQLNNSSKELGYVTFYIPNIQLERNSLPLSMIEVLVGNSIYKTKLKSNYNVFKSFVSHEGIDTSYYLAKEREYNVNSVFRNMVYTYSYNFFKNSAKDGLESVLDVEIRPWDSMNVLYSQTNVPFQIFPSDNGDFSDIEIPGEMIPKY